MFAFRLHSNKLRQMYRNIPETPVIDNPEVAHTNAPTFSIREFLDSRWSWVVGKSPYGIDDAILVRPRYVRELSLSSSFDEQLVCQSGVLSRISETAWSKGIGSEGRLFASSYARTSLSSSSNSRTCVHSEMGTTTAVRLPSPSTRYCSCNWIMVFSVNMDDLPSKV